MHAGVTEKSDDDHDEKNDQPCGSCHEVLSCSTLVCDGLYGLIWSFGEAPGPFVFVDASQCSAWPVPTNQRLALCLGHGEGGSFVAIAEALTCAFVWQGRLIDAPQCR